MFSFKKNVFKFLVGVYKWYGIRDILADRVGLVIDLN
jgi:hypothetical protein